MNTMENSASLPTGVEGTPRLLITKMVRTACYTFHCGKRGRNLIDKASNRFSLKKYLI
jgi:hypothetical protein